ncbi:MAG: DinB family protein [Saprospiraceae bacterium]|nr:DinB family protein [Saprospiraceae bacterium]
MYKNQIEKMPAYFDTYISHVPDMKIIDALHQYGQSYLQVEKDKLKELEDQIYAAGKWTAKEILQHLIDTERIFSYRALRFARADETPLPGFDENKYAQNINTSRRTIDDLLLEFAAVRQSTLGLFIGLDEVELQRVGTASNQQISVLALGFTIVGHVIHHINVIKERYYPLLEK